MTTKCSTASEADPVKGYYQKTWWYSRASEVKYQCQPFDFDGYTVVV